MWKINEVGSISGSKTQNRLETYYKTIFSLIGSTNFILSRDSIVIPKVKNKRITICNLNYMQRL